MSATIETLDTEMELLAAALAEPQDAQTELLIRQRFAYVAQRHAELEQAQPFAEATTAELGMKLDEAQEKREELLGELLAAKEDAQHPARAKRLEREFEALQKEQSALRQAFDDRSFAEATTVLGQHRAEVVARREIKETDAEALEGLDDWRREKARESLAESRDKRVAKHSEIVYKRLVKNAELEAGARLVGLGPGMEPVPFPMSQEEEDDEGLG